MFDERIEALNASVTTAPILPYEDKKTYTVTEIQDILGISQSTAYLLIKRGEFHSVKIGRHIRVSKTSFDAWLDGMAQ